MVSEHIAARHMLRFMVLRKSDTCEGDAYEREIVAALSRASLNPEHCARIVERWITSKAWRPTPADIYETADAVPLAGFSAKRDPKCAKCQGTGYEQVWQLVTYEHPADGAVYKSEQYIEDRCTALDLRSKVDGHQQVLYEGVRHCRACEYGRELNRVQAVSLPEQKNARAGNFSEDKEHNAKTEHSASAC